jgi:hypothetical protein
MRTYVCMYARTMVQCRRIQPTYSTETLIVSHIPLPLSLSLSIKIPVADHLQGFSFTVLPSIMDRTAALHRIA